jgi:hypothetical protein
MRVMVCLHEFAYHLHDVAEDLLLAELKRDLAEHHVFIPGR